MEKIKKKILLVTFEFPPALGGVENYYFNLINNLSNYEFIVLTIPNEKANSFDLEQNFKIIRENLLSKFNYPKWFKLFKLIKNLIKVESIDLIWVGDVLPVGNAVYLINKLYKIPYFVSTHGIDIMLPQKNKRKEMIMKKILKNSSFITANSKFTLKQIANIGLNEEKIKLLYPAVTLNPQQYDITKKDMDELSNKYNLNDKIILITVSRLVKRKGHETIIRILPELLNEIPNLVYLIVGTGTYLSELKKLVDRLNLNNQVIFLGAVSDQTLATLYKLSKIFIMPAKDIQGDVEGFGIVYLDANSFGLPVIAGNTGGVKEAVLDNKTGILIDPNNKGELGQAILKLINDKELYSKMSQAGIKHVVLFNWLKQSKILSDLIEKNG